MAEASVALIPARGGSKRLPRKNVIDFLGRPIIAYTIDAALESGCFGRVVVSTEDDQIARVAARCGAEIDRRPAQLAEDHIGLVQVCLNFLDREAVVGRDCNILACLYATAALRNAQDIRETVELVRSGRCQFAMAVTPYLQYPHQALQFAEGGRLTPMWPDLVTKRGSDLPALRAGNGTTYVVSVADFRRHRTFYGPGLHGYEMPFERSVDIDTQSDLDYAIWLAQTIRVAQGSAK